MRDWLGWTNWVLLALIVVSIPSLDGVCDSGASGPWRAAAAWYVVIASAVLIIQPAQHTLLQTLSWASLGGACMMYVITSPVPYFWAVIALGALTQSARTALGCRKVPVKPECQVTP